MGGFERYTECRPKGFHTTMSRSLGIKKTGGNDGIDRYDNTSWKDAVALSLTNYGQYPRWYQMQIKKATEEFPTMMGLLDGYIQTGSDDDLDKALQFYHNITKNQYGLNFQDTPKGKLKKFLPLLTRALDRGIEEVYESGWKN